MSFGKDSQTLRHHLLKNQTVCNENGHIGNPPHHFSWLIFVVREKSGMVILGITNPSLEIPANVPKMIQIQSNSRIRTQNPCPKSLPEIPELSTKKIAQEIAFPTSLAMKYAGSPEIPPNLGKKSFCFRKIFRVSFESASRRTFTEQLFNSWVRVSEGKSWKLQF